MTEGGRAITRMLVSARRGGGLIDAVKDADMAGGDRQQRLNDAVARYETAIRDGRDLDAEIADAAIDAVLEEGRAARNDLSNVGREDVQEPVPSFDGGVRRGPVGSRRRPGVRDESAAQLFSRAMTQSHIEAQNGLRVPPMS